jgi:hypothetical protein
MFHFLLIHLAVVGAPRWHFAFALSRGTGFSPSIDFRQASSRPV